MNDKKYYDFLKQEIEIGDDVLYVVKGYRNLNKGKILRLGERKATIDTGNDKTLIQFYDQFITVKNIKNIDSLKSTNKR